MKRLILLIILINVQGCSDSEFPIKSSSVSEQNLINSTSKMQDTQIKEQNNSESAISDGIYFSYKTCATDNSCQIFEPLKSDGKFLLSRDQDSNESQYYLTVDDKDIYLYSLKFVDEEFREVGTWAKLQKSKHAQLSYKIESIEQVMGLDYMGRYDNDDVDKKLATISNKTGLIEIGNPIHGNTIPTHESIRFIPLNDDYKLDCDSYMEDYNNIADHLYEQGNMAVGYHFYYECLAGESIYFHKVN